jgi:hypothetical protein
MTIDEASNVLPGEQVEVDSSVFTASPQPTGEWVRCRPRFLQSKRGIGGWADISGDRMYVLRENSIDGLYAPLARIRKPQ